MVLAVFGSYRNNFQHIICLGIEKVTVNGASYDFQVSANGKISIDGSEVTLTSSTDKIKYLSSDGWQMFTHSGRTFYLLIKEGEVQLIPAPSKSLRGHPFRMSGLPGGGGNLAKPDIYCYFERNAFFQFLIFCLFGSFLAMFWSNFRPNLKNRIFWLFPGSKMIQKGKISKIEKIHSLPIH